MTANKQQTRVHIRWMIRRDMAEVLDIEDQWFEFPWYEEDFIRCLRQRNCIGMICEYDERVVGFMVYELLKSQLDLLTLAVLPAMHRQGIGEQMITKLKLKLSSQRRNRIMLAVRETNLRAQQFFKAQGFRATNVLRDHYEDTPEDAYVMQYRHKPLKSEAKVSANRIKRLAP